MRLHLFDGYIQTIYLAEYPDKLMLLDGATRADVDTIQDFITEKLNRPLSDLKLVISTHMHPDHAGAATILKKNTGCKIAASNVDCHWYKGLDGWLMYVTDMLLAKWVAKRIGKKPKWLWYPRKLTPDILLNDQQLIPEFSDWQVHFSQGHTDRDISLLHLPTHKIYVADLIVKVKGQLSPPFPIFYPNRYKTSLSNLITLEPAGIYIAHGEELTPTDTELQTLLSKAPNKPVTHWRSIKYKFNKAFSRIKPN